MGPPSGAGSLILCSAIAPNRSEHVAPGRTHGKGSINQADVGVGLREIAALGTRSGDEMLGEQSDMIGSEEYSIKNDSGLGGPSQPGERLRDPKRADDEGSFRFSEVVVSHVAVKKAGVLVPMSKCKFPGNVQHCGFTELLVRIAQDRELSEGGVITEIRGAVSERAAMYAPEEGLRRLDPCGGQVQGDRTEMPGLSDALQSFETSPTEQVGKGMFLPSVADLPEAGVRLADTADAQLCQMGQERVEIFAAQIAIPFVEEDRRKGQNHFSIGITLHMFRRLIVAANRYTALIAGPIRMLGFR